MNIQNKLPGGLARAEGDPQVLEKGPSSMSWADRSARNLGWFSHALGMAEIFATRRITGALGMEGHETLVRAYGVREVGAGLGALSVTKTPFIWSRVAGDVLDIGTLLAFWRDDNPKKKNVGIALAAVAGVTAIDILTAIALQKQQSRGAEPARSYSDRSGWSGSVEQARGAARDFETPRDLRAQLPEIGEGGRFAGASQPQRELRGEGEQGGDQQTEAGNPGEFKGASQPA